MRRAFLFALLVLASLSNNDKRIGWPGDNVRILIELLCKERSNSCAKSDSGSDRLVIGWIKSSFAFDECFFPSVRLTDLKSREDVNANRVADIMID